MKWSKFGANLDSCIKDVIIAKRGVIFSGKSKPPRLREEKRLNSKYGRERERGTLTAFYVLLTMELIRFEVLARLTDCCVPPVICVPNVFSLHLGKKKKKNYVYITILPQQIVSDRILVDRILLVIIRRRKKKDISVMDS